MKILKLHRSESSRAYGLVVVIDVIRAFTTAAVAFDRGLQQIDLVGDVQEAFSLKKKFPDSLLIGEVEGMRIPGFDHNNSPWEMMQADLQGKKAIMRTTSGTPGVVCAQNASSILVGSFVVAEATYQRIRTLNPRVVTFMITGRNDGSEDEAFADYLIAQLQGKEAHPQEYLRRVLDSPAGRKAGKRICHERTTQADLDVISSLNLYPFAMEVTRRDKRHILHAVDQHGCCLSL